MRIGIYQDLRDPEPWRRGWHTVYGSALERIESAEHLGIDMAWCTEHHFFEDGYLPQPLTWCAAAAARTKRIGIGTAIVIAPLHHPLEIAEQAALVDQISGGRLQLGLGAGYMPREFEAFGVDLKRRFRVAEERVTEVKRLLDGRLVTPYPAQARIPIWFGGFGPRGARYAGREGLGLLHNDTSLLEPYMGGLEEGGHQADVAAIGGATMMVITRDPERAWATVVPHLEYMWKSYLDANGEGSGASSTNKSLPSEEDEIDSVSLRSSGPAMLPPGFDAVTPEEAVSRIRAWLGDSPVSDLYFLDSVSGMPDDLVEEHIELLASEVRPKLLDVGKTDHLAGRPTSAGDVSG